MILRFAAVRRMYAILIGVALTLFLPVNGRSEVAKERRFEDTNVILISLQCLRPDHLGVYGYGRETSSNIDSFAREGVVFENAIAQANLTPVAQMSVLTAQYPRVNGMVSFEVPKEMVTGRTLPEILKYYGYTTAASVSSPEFFMRFDTESGEIVNPGDVFSRSFDYFGRTIKGARGTSVRTMPWDALDWLKANSDRKFFLWVGSGLLHMPYSAAVPAPYRTMFDPPGYRPFWLRGAQTEGDTDSGAPSYGIFSRVFAGDYHVGFKPVRHLDEQDLKYVNARYDAGVYYTDRFIGELLKLLDSLKLSGKTLIVIHSIHGDDLGERGMFFHYDISETVMKNALIMRFPKGEFAGRRVTEQVQGVDLVPTLLDYLGIPADHRADGRTFLPLLRGERDASTNRYAYMDRLPWWEYTLSRWYLEHEDAKGVQYPPEEEAKLREYASMLRMRFKEVAHPPGDIGIRTNEWKLVLRRAPELLEEVSWWRFITGRKQAVEAVELYDLKRDPLETKNVAGEFPAVVRRMKEKLIEWDENVTKRQAQHARQGQRWIIPYP